MIFILCLYQYLNQTCCTGTLIVNKIYIYWKLLKLKTITCMNLTMVFIKATYVLGIHEPRFGFVWDESFLSDSRWLLVDRYRIWQITSLWPVGIKANDTFVVTMSSVNVMIFSGLDWYYSKLCDTDIIKVFLSNASIVQTAGASQPLHPLLATGLCTITIILN